MDRLATVNRDNSGEDYSSDNNSETSEPLVTPHDNQNENDPREEFIKDDDDFNLSDSSNLEESDDDSPQEEVTLKGLIWNFIQMIIYTGDIFTDGSLGLTYLAEGKYLYSALTFAVIYTAAGIDAYFNRSEFKRKSRDYKYVLKWVLAMLFNVRGLSVYYKFVKMRYDLYRGINTVKETQEDFFDRNFRVANLKTHEGLFEACPQLLLQLYIMLVTVEEKLSFTFLQQNVSVLISLTSLATTFITGDTARRLYEHERDNFSKWGWALQFFWIFPVTASRILALSCVCSVLPILSVSCFLLHGFVSFLYLRLSRSQSYTTFGALVAAIRVFLTPYEPIEQYDTDVTFRLIRSHLLHFIGNVLAIAIWAVKTDLYHKWFTIYIVILFFFISGFLLGISSLTLLIVYKNNFFIPDNEKESKIDRKMQPFIDRVSGIINGIKKRFNTLKYNCQIKRRDK